MNKKLKNIVNIMINIKWILFIGLDCKYKDNNLTAKYY
jgi:hypothetical protein